MSLALCALLFSLCGSAYSTAVWPQTSYNAQRTSFSMSNTTSRTVECQPTLTSTIQLSKSSVYLDWDFDPVIGNNSVLYYNKDQRSLAAFDVSSNTVLWTLEANSSFSAPVLSQDGQLLYTLRDVINFTVYSVKTKEIVWYYDRIPLEKLSDFHKNIVIAPNGIVYLNIVELVASNFAALYAFDISMASNTELWNRTGFQFSTPVVSEDGKLYARDDEALYSLNPATGSTIWTLPTEHSNATGGIRVRSDGNLLCKTDRYLLLVSPGGDILDNATDFEDFAVTPDGRVIGVLVNPPYPTVTLLNSDFDRFEWSVAILPIVFTSLTISVIDNEIYVHTIDSDTGSTSIVKFDMEGNIIWKTSVQYTPETIGFGFSNVIPVGDGSIIVRTGTFLQHFTSCNAGNGTCKTLGGICECKANYFGDSCSAHCECENGKCSATGQCQCDEGWSGADCSTKESNNALVIGLSVGVGVLVVGAVAAFLLIRHRRKSHYEEISH